MPLLDREKSEITEITPIIPRRNFKREMTAAGKSINIFIQIILLIVVVYIISRTVDSVGVVLFTWHPVLISLGVSGCLNFISVPQLTMFTLLCSISC